MMLLLACWSRLPHPKYDDRRFHEAPGAGAINGWPASANSIVVAGLREWLDFFLLPSGF